jgi:hypothetical protein
MRHHPALITPELAAALPAPCALMLDAAAPAAAGRKGNVLRAPEQVPMLSYLRLRMRRMVENKLHHLSGSPPT